MVKHYVIDTNVLLYDSNSITMFEDNNVHIPMVVLEELDRFKRDMNELGVNARHAINYLDSLRSRGKLSSGVKLDSGGTLFVSSSDQKIDSSLLNEYADNKLLQLSSYLKSLNHGTKVILVTKDINLRVKADALGIESEDYKNPSEGDGVDYDGVANIAIDGEIINKLYSDGYIEASDEMGLIENQYIFLTSITEEKHNGMAVYKNGKIYPIKNKIKAAGISPKNMRQCFAFDALLDKDIKVVTLSGISGTGKTLLCTSAAIQQTLFEDVYRKITITRPTISVGKELGFLPGDVEEKLDPWMKPIYDALDLIKEIDASSGKSKFSSQFIPEDYIQIAPLCYIRGRSLINSFMLIDECLTKDQLIWTHDGKAIPIQDIKNNMSVISIDIDNKKQNINNVKNTFSRKTKKLIEIKTSHGNLECTPSHNLWVYENGEILIKKKAKDLTKNDLVILANKMSHYVKNDLSINNAKLLGLILTAGHIDKHLNEMKIEYSKDKDWLLKTFNEITTDFKTSIQKNELRNTLICRIKNPKDVKNFVEKYKLPSGNKSNIITVPDDIWNAPIESVKKFIQICFDAEGDVNFNSKNNNLVINFSSTSKVFSNQLQSLLLKFSIFSNIYEIKRRKKQHHNSYRLSIINNEAIKFLECIGFSIDRKQNIYEFVKNNNNFSDLIKYPIKSFLDLKNKLTKSTKWEKSSFSYGDLYEKIGGMVRTKKIKTISKKIYDNIISISKNLNIEIETYFNVARINKINVIELEEETDVYDFEVENDHTFIVNGIVSSNCQNLSPLEIKTILTRVGQGTKIVLTGDVFQIDNPYLNKYSNGLSQLIKKFKGMKFYSHITLTEGERSEVAEAAASVL